jgi:anaerobic selenocysteine-containing dehydrogenase
VLIHPDDLAALGRGEGARLRLGNERGSVVVPARAFDGVQRGVVVVEGIWPNTAFEEGIGINALTSAEPGPPAGGLCSTIPRSGSGWFDLVLPGGAVREV